MASRVTPSRGSLAVGLSKDNHTFTSWRDGCLLLLDIVAAQGFDEGIYGKNAAGAS